MPTESHPAAAGVREQLIHECVAMCRFALAQGLTVPASVLTTVEQARATAASKPVDLAGVGKVHSQLCKLVAPATPRTLLLLGDEHNTKRRFPMLGPVGLVRRLMFAAALSTVLFVAVSLFPAINDDTVTVQNAQGLDLFLVEVFWLCAAAMGAAFALLMQVSGYVVKRNYDPKYEASYWIKFMLGIMSGFILVALIPIDEVKGSALPVARPALALLGGFSASAVYQILTRMVETVESLFSSSTRDKVAASETAARSQVATETSEVRVGLAGQLVALQHAVASGESGAAVTERIQSIVAALVPAGGADGTATASAADDAPPAASPAAASTDTAQPAAAAQTGTAAAPDAQSQADTTSSGDAQPSADAAVPAGTVPLAGVTIVGAPAEADPGV